MVATDALAAGAKYVILEGDNRVIMPTLDPVDHILTDPPFEMEAHTLQRRVKREGGIMEVEPLSFDPMTPEHRAICGLEFGRLAKRWIGVFCQLEAAMIWRDAFRGEVNYRRTCIWVKPDGMPQYSGDRPGMGYETLVMMHREGRSRWNGGGQVGVFVHNKNANARDKAQHPTQKPLALMQELVRLFTDPGEIILDPFCGSGSTGVAALTLGRRFIGIEQNPTFAQIARDRCEAAKQNIDYSALRNGQRGLFSEE